MCEHFAAVYLNIDFPVVSVLTDLNLFWQFFWFAAATDDVKRKICVFKLELSRQTAGADAKHLLESMFSGSAQAPNALPTTFTDRLSFRAVLDSFHANESVDGSKRVKFNHDDGGPPDQDSKYLPSTGQDRGQSSGSGLSSSSMGGGGTVHQNYHGSASAGGAASLSMANVLSLFAPPFYRDVANELDLLDMVDKNEQYEIVRAFTAKHIVPHMLGRDEI